MSAIKLLSSIRSTNNSIFRCWLVPNPDHDCYEYFTVLINGVEYDVCERHLPNGAWESATMYHYINDGTWISEIFTNEYFAGFIHDFIKTKI